jgi:hypothetical protein
MKTSLLYCLLLLTTWCSSCRSLSYFDSPNNLRNIEGTLFLQNGRTYEGKLVIETENLFGRPVKLFVDDDKKPMQFSLNDVKGYAARNAYYELREIREGVSIGRQLYFMRRLTPENSRIHLFEFLKKRTVNKTSVRHDPEFYLQLPGEEGMLVYAANGSRFVPHFEEKISRLVSDCPTLSRKIAEKKEGYFYAQVSLLRDKRADVLLQIIREYNQCGGNNSGLTEAKQQEENNMQTSQQ